MDTRFRAYYLVTFNDQWWLKGKDGVTLYNENIKALCDMVPDLKITNPNWQTIVADGYYNRKVSCLKEDEDMLVNALNILEPNGVKWVKVDQEKYTTWHAKRNSRMYKRKKEWQERLEKERMMGFHSVTIHLGDESWRMLKKYADYFTESVEYIAKNMFYIGLNKYNSEILE